MVLEEIKSEKAYWDAEPRLREDEETLNCPVEELYEASPIAERELSTDWMVVVVSPTMLEEVINPCGLRKVAVMPVPVAAEKEMEVFEATERTETGVRV